MRTRARALSPQAHDLVQPAGIMDLREAKSVDPASNDPLAFRIVMPDKEYLLKYVRWPARSWWRLATAYARARAFVLALAGRLRRTTETSGACASCTQS